MGILRVDYYLTAVSSDGAPVTEDRFVGPLRAAVDDTVAATSSGKNPWEDGVIDFFKCARDREGDADEFMELQREREHGIARWIASRADTIASLQSDRLSIKLRIELELYDGPVELPLVPELVAACAAARIGIAIGSNDFSGSG